MMVALGGLRERGRRAALRLPSAPRTPHPALRLPMQAEPVASLARAALAAVAPLLPWRGAAAQEWRDEFWPEVDVYWQATPTMRLFFLASISRARETGDTEVTLGPHVDYRPNRSWLFRIGCDDGTSISNDSYREHLGIGEVTLAHTCPPGSSCATATAWTCAGCATASPSPARADAHPVCDGRAVPRQPPL